MRVKTSKIGSMEKLDFRRKKMKEMLEAMIAVGIRRKEIMKAVGCSRWTITLWLEERHYPSDESFEAVKRAYAEFRPEAIPELDILIERLKDRGVNLTEKLRCADSSVYDWANAVRWPQARYRRKLVELYRQHYGRAA